MFRKAMFALTALTVLGAAALAPTSASAGWKHHHNKHWGHGYGHSYGYGYGAYTVGYSTCWVKRWVGTPYGPRLQRVYVCY